MPVPQEDADPEFSADPSPFLIPAADASDDVQTGTAHTGEAFPPVETEEVPLPPLHTLVENQDGVRVPIHTTLVVHPDVALPDVPFFYPDENIGEVVDFWNSLPCAHSDVYLTCIGRDHPV